MDTEHISKLITLGNYNEAFSCFESQTLVDSEIRNIILSIVSETDSISVYGFCLFAYQKTEKEVWLALTIDVLLLFFSHIEGVYGIVNYYAHYACSTYPTLDNYLRILYLYELPVNLVSREEAVQTARIIMDINPKNDVARRVLCSNMA